MTSWVTVAALAVILAAGASSDGHRRKDALEIDLRRACESEHLSGGGTASFRLVDSAGSRTLEYGAGNLVFCRTTSATMVWIRFAESPANDGGAGPHLDLDVCHLGQGGTFAPMEARANPCPGGQTWAAWWHGGSGAVHANRAASTPCELRLEIEGTTLRGTFSCRGLVTEDGAGTVDLLDGRFECEWERAGERPRPR
jgi:hypothetical protein